MAHNNRKPKMLPYTLKDFQRQYPDDATCLEWLRNYLYPDGIYCIKCEATTKHHRVKSRPSYSCDHCGHHVHPTAGTIFHKSPTPLSTWFYAIYLMASTRCGISAKQIQRETGVTYKTAWRMFKQIRTMLDERDSGQLGGGGKGGVEMDETYYGGRGKSYPGRASATDKHAKTPVVGMVERKGRHTASCHFPGCPNSVIQITDGFYFLPCGAILRLAFFSAVWKSSLVNDDSFLGLAESIPGTILRVARLSPSFLIATSFPWLIVSRILLAGTTIAIPMLTPRLRS